MGRFDQLLPKAITHPAMMIFLTGANSTKDHPNENLARELLELHTVGVGVFDEDDVKNAALVLTGFRIANPGGWTASYDPAVHYTGPVRVLGFSHANRGPRRAPPSPGSCFATSPGTPRPHVASRPGWPARS